MYRITISKEEKMVVKTKVWKQLKDEGEGMYGYVENQETDRVSIELLDQRVETLDLVKIIKAINNIT